MEIVIVSPEDRQLTFRNLKKGAMFLTGSGNLLIKTDDLMAPNRNALEITKAGAFSAYIGPERVVRRVKKIIAELED
jgi:hypothetical protein